MIHKSHQLQIRLDDYQLAQLEKAHNHYMTDNKEVITRSEFVRRMLKTAFAIELGMIEIMTNKEEE